MRTRWVTPAALVVVALVTAGLSGCDRGGGAAPSAPSTTAPATTTAAADPFAAKNRTPDPQAVAIGLTKISLATAATGDQVIFEFTGNAVPGWAVHYVGQAVPNPGPAVLPMAGQSIIEVLIREAANPFKTGVPAYAGANPVIDPAVRSISEVRFASADRGITQAFIGLAIGQVGFRVTALTNPTRVVVEVDHR
ncbi:hypothetical protein JK358_06610 [Nocardia sp. 2]|uniref:AMIN-like domain-containing protein n=1 Tax=Nocardia acididurans TaxID=2802282 RepID=A0ABS1M4J7_9NOCA|nr:hypothetical protein [Nocardia acididurans]MBL1074063.1 hypothetical protein [Nocardia acididurans]